MLFIFVILFSDDDDITDVCMSKLPLIICMIAVMSTILSSAGAEVYLYRNLKAKTEHNYASNNT